MDRKKQTQFDQLILHLWTTCRHISYTGHLSVFLIQDQYDMFWIADSIRKLNPKCFGRVKPTMDQIRKFFKG